jgi:hypothetical protein
MPVPPVNPPPIQGPQMSNKPPPTTESVGDGSHKFLGMIFDKKEWKELWAAVTQTISTQIQKDQEKMKEAMKKISGEDEENQ